MVPLKCIKLPEQTIISNEKWKYVNIGGAICGVRLYFWIINGYVGNGKKSDYRKVDQFA